MKKTHFSLLLLCFVTFFSYQTFAQTGEALTLNGVDQYMQIPNHTDFNITTSENFTISMWINVAEFTNSNARFLSKRLVGTTSDDKSGYEFFGANDASHYWATNTPNAANSHANSLSVWPPSYNGSVNTWTHIAFVVDRVGGVMYQYIDGTQVTSSNGKDITPWAVQNNYDLYVGCGISGSTTPTPSSFFNGKIDNLRIWKKALTPEEIVADKTSTVNTTTEGLVAAYDFENVENATVPDIKGNHPATLHNFPTAGGDVLIDAVTVQQQTNYTGRGNENEDILRVKINTNGTGTAELTSITINSTGTTDVSDVEQVKIYATGTVASFDSRNPTTAGATLLGTLTPTTGEMNIPISGSLSSGTNYLWVVYAVKENAKEGNKLDASITKLVTNKETYLVSNGAASGNREILLRRVLVLAPNDYGSKNYRIPAIVTAQDGSLVTLTDKRKYNSTDLPEDIDIVAKRSTDGGKTWSDPVTVAQGTGRNHGYGDAVLMVSNSGKLVALYVGGVSLWASTPSNPMRTYISESTDNGITWTAPRDITSQIYGSECSDATRSGWEGLFFGSGHGLCTKAGRLMAVVAVRVPGRGGLQNHAVYSDDEGATWKVSQEAISGGDEAKVVELNNGDILMSSRHQGNRYWVKSSDGGVTWGSRNEWTEIWGNACDADIVRYTSTLDNYDKDRILHTLPNNGGRENVTMWISYDEATTWPIKKTLCAGSSAYSSITILNDGTIGVYLEEDGSVPYKMYYLNFSLEWLTDGADSYTPPNTPIVATPTVSVPAGRYGEEQTITLACTTPDAQIYYTLDGSAPNANATVYTSPITISSTTTLKMIAIKDGYANSVVQSFEYTIGWVVPGETRPTIDQRYLTSVTTENAKVNLNYSASEVPASYYVAVNDQTIEVEAGKTFTLNLTGLTEQGDGLQWCQAIIVADWNRDFTFAADERVAIVGQRTRDNGTELLNISQEITVPENAVIDKTTRLRVVYTDGWRPSGLPDLGEDDVDKGRLYDFNIKVLKNTATSTIQHKTSTVLLTNPVTDELKLRVRTAGKFNIALFDTKGRFIKKASYDVTMPKDIYMSCADINTGFYVLMITNEAGVTSYKKVIKE